MILDTSYLGDLMARNEGALNRSREMDESPEPVRLPTAVVWEVFYGLGKMGNSSRTTTFRRKYDQVIAGTVAADLTDDVARRAGTLRGKHAASDRLSDLDGVDSIVAAHGLILDEPVVAGDGDFEDVGGLDVVTY